MSRWFRVYDDMLDDPKVQLLSPELFRAWMNCLALTSRNKGCLPPMAQIAFALRCSAQDAQARIDDLILAGLIDILPDGRMQPHNWPKRQFASDASTERVRKHREKRRGNVSSGVSETPPESESDPEDEEPSTSSVEQVAAREDEGSQSEVFDDGMGLDEAGPPTVACRRVAFPPETLRSAALAAGIADASPLVDAYWRWQDRIAPAKRARDPEANFIACAARFFATARPEVRAACQPAQAPPPVVIATAKPSSALAAKLAKDRRYAH